MEQITVIRERAAKLWYDLCEAVRGSDQDFTEGSIGRAILLLSVPMVLEMAMESVFAIVDIFFVSRLGADAVAAVGLTESMLTIIYAVGGGLSMATTALVARRTGEKNLEQAAVTAVQAIICGVLISLPFAYIGLFHARDLLKLMGASDSMTASSSTYPQIMIGGNALVMLLFIINAVFRGAGDASIAMRSLFIANIINIILDPCMIFGLGPFPRMGIAGAAAATAIGRGIGVLYQLYLLGNGKHRIKIIKKHLVFNFRIIKRLLRLSAGGVAQSLIATTSWIWLVRIMAVFGSAALAGYTIAIRIIVFSILPAWGLSNAASTMVGQNLGADKPERAERSVWITGFINMIFLVLIAVIFILFPAPLVRIFSNDAAVVKIGALSLRIISCGYLFYSYGMVMMQAFNGAGDTFTPTVINFFCFWMFEIPLAYILALHLKLAEKGVCLAVVCAESLVGIIGILVFRSGRWKKKKV